MGKVKTYKVTGLSHYEDAIKKLRCENLDYDLKKKELIEEGLIDERVYQYEYWPSKAELIPEPDNPYDPNAVKVVLDGEHVGYIKAGSCKHILNLLKNNRIKKIDCEMAGGKYKYVYSYEEYYEEKYDLETGDHEVFVKLLITEE